VYIRGAMIRALLPHIEEHAEVRAAISTQIRAAITDVASALTELNQTLDAHRYSLLSERGGYADLYHLPIRVSHVLGWIGFITISQDAVGIVAMPSITLRRLVGKVLKTYGNSVVALGDDQAAHFLSFLVAAKATDWIDEAEEVTGRLYFDFNENMGRVLVNAPLAADILDYLILRAERPLECQGSFLQSPSELFSVILLGAAMLRLDDAIDDSLIQLDHTHFAFYVPESYGEFWQESMETGRSVVSQLGHAVWT